MKYSTLIALLGTSSAHVGYNPKHNVSFDLKKMEAIVAGVLQGAIDAEGFTDIDTCIKDGSTILSDAELAYQYLHAGGAANIIDALQEVVLMIKPIKAGMQDCSAIKADWEKLEQMMEPFMSPKEFIYHVEQDLIVNGAQIFDEIKSATGSYEQGKYYEFGEYLGEAMAQTFLGKVPATRKSANVEFDMSKMVQIVEGFLSGAIHEENFTDIDTCIADGETILADAELAIQYMKAGGAANYLDALQELALMIKPVRAGMTDCSSIKADFGKLEAMMKPFETPSTFAYHVEQDLLLNGTQIFSEMKSAVSSYEAGKYRDFGMYIGEAAAKTFIGEPVNAGKLFLY